MIQIVRKQKTGAKDERIRRMERDLLHLWEFIWQEGLGEDAREFISNSTGEPIPFQLE